MVCDKTGTAFLAVKKRVSRIRREFDHADVRQASSHREIIGQPQGVEHLVIWRLRAALRFMQKAHSRAAIRTAAFQSP